MTKPTIYQQLFAAGVEVSSHESDLYALFTPVSGEIIEAFEFKASVTTFREFGDPDGRTLYEIPFAFDPWYEARGLTKPGDPSHTADPLTLLAFARAEMEDWREALCGERPTLDALAARIDAVFGLETKSYDGEG